MDQENKKLPLETGIAVAIVLFLVIFSGGYFKGATPAVSEEMSSAARLAAPTPSINENYPREVMVQVVAPGTGAEVKAGDRITFNYTLRNLDGQVLSSTVESATPVSFTLGKGEALEGLELAFLGKLGSEVTPMKVGEKRSVYLPPEMAYGQTGSPDGSVPANTPLVYELELVAIN